jgi:hypothetical protein
VRGGSGPDEPGDGGGGLGDLGLGGGAVVLGAAGDRVPDAVAQVVVEQAEVAAETWVSTSMQ